MNFNDLLAKLEKIDKKKTLMEQTLMEQLTLQQVQAVEKDAMAKAEADKKTGRFGGIFKLDPRTAGNVALAKLAAQHKLPGLFNSKGEFVVADDKRGDINSYTQKPTTAVQIAPPNSEATKALAALGLIPGNASGPSGLVNVLSGGKAQQGFDAEKATSAKVGADQTSAKFKADKLKQLNDLVAKLNAEVQGGNTDPGVGKVDYKIAESLLKEFGLSEKADPSRPASMKTVNGMNIYTNDPVPANAGPAGGTPFTPALPGGGGDLVSQINAIMKELGDMGDDPEVVAALNAAQKVLDAKKAADAKKATTAQAGTAQAGTAQAGDDDAAKRAKIEHQAGVKYGPGVPLNVPFSKTLPAFRNATELKMEGGKVVAVDKDGKVVGTYDGENRWQATPAGGSTVDLSQQPGGNTTTAGGNTTTAGGNTTTAGGNTTTAGGEKGSKPTTPQSTAQEKMDRFVFLMNKKKASAGGPTTVTNPAQASQTVVGTQESLVNLMSRLKMLEESVLSEALDPAEEKELQAISQEVINTVNSGAEGIPPEVLAAVKEFQASASPTQINNPADATKTASGYKGSAGSQEIQKLNPEIKDVNKIRVGQTIKLPGDKEYVVAKGDTLDGIAAGKYKGTPPGGMDRIGKPNAAAANPANPAAANPANPAATNTQQAKAQPYVSPTKAANDWAFSVFTGAKDKAGKVQTIDNVPKELRAEVDKVLANPPSNWKKPDAPAAPAAGGQQQAAGGQQQAAPANPAAASSGQVRIERLDIIKARSTQEYLAIVKAKGYKQDKDGKLSPSDERKADMFYKAEIQNGKIKNYPQLQPVAEELDRILSIAGLR